MVDGFLKLSKIPVLFFFPSTVLFGEGKRGIQPKFRGEKKRKVIGVCVVWTSQQGIWQAKATVKFSFVLCTSHQSSSYFALLDSSGPACPRFKPSIPNLAPIELVTIPKLILK